MSCSITQKGRQAVITLVFGQVVFCIWVDLSSSRKHLNNTVQEPTTCILEINVHTIILASSLGVVVVPGDVWPRKQPFWIEVAKRFESSKILKSIHMSNSEFMSFQKGAESWEVRKSGELDLIIQWFEDLMTWWFKSFPATVQNGRFLGQNCSRNISDGAVLDPLFGRLMVNR